MKISMTEEFEAREFKKGDRVVPNIFRKSFPPAVVKALVGNSGLEITSVATVTAEDALKWDAPNRPKVGDKVYGIGNDGDRKWFHAGELTRFGSNQL
jgi:hypothetical protein